LAVVRPVGDVTDDVGRPRVSNLASDAAAFTSNVFLVAGERTVLVDAGANFDVVAALREHTETLDAVVLTHTHPDHVGNVEDLRGAFGVETWGFDADAEAVDHAVADGETVRIGDHAYEALHTPGHAPDHLCLYAADAGVLFAGDLVFQGGAFGRTDLQGADRRTLVSSVDRLLDRVDPDCRVLYAGHGPAVEEPYPTVELAREVAGRE
jgi:glyoxylase-like metal-dependent hydrolase (beta-lactamase superfamily II)